MKLSPKYLSHKEVYEDAVKKSCLILKKVKEFQDTGRGGDINIYS